MLRIRLAAAGAMLVMAVGSATAQTATSAPDRPLSLLPIAHRANGATAPVRERTAPRLTKRRFARTHRKTHRTLVARHARSPAQTGTEETAAAARPAPDSATPAANAAIVSPSRPAPQPAAVFPDPATSTLPNELVIGGQTVQVTSPNDINALDLASGGPDQAAAAAPPTDNAEPAKSAPPQPVVRAMVARTEPADTSPVGSASWIAQVLAALGGAIAAGAVAWFLIGPVPLRRYG